MYLCGFCHFFYFSQTKRKLAGIGDQPETFCLLDLSSVVCQGKENKANACMYLRMYMCVCVCVRTHTSVGGSNISRWFFFSLCYVWSNPSTSFLPRSCT